MKFKFCNSGFVSSLSVEFISETTRERTYYLKLSAQSSPKQKLHQNWMKTKIPYTFENMRNFRIFTLDPLFEIKLKFSMFHQ